MSLVNLNRENNFIQYSSGVRLHGHYFHQMIYKSFRIKGIIARFSLFAPWRCYNNIYHSTVKFDVKINTFINSNILKPILLYHWFLSTKINNKLCKIQFKRGSNLEARLFVGDFTVLQEMLRESLLKTPKLYPKSSSATGHQRYVQNGRDEMLFKFNERSLKSSLWLQAKPAPFTRVLALALASHFWSSVTMYFQRYGGFYGHFFTSITWIWRNVGKKLKSISSHYQTYLNYSCQDPSRKLGK